MADIFLSYSREDQAVARTFAESLEREGFSVWWDQTLRSGEAYDEITERALRSAAAVVVLWSTRSVASRWVRSEATIADRAGRLLPVMIEPCDRPVMFELRQTADLTGWQGDTDDRRWQIFIGDLRALVGQQTPQIAEPTISQSQRVPQLAAPVPDASRRRRMRVVAGAAGVLLLAALLAWWLSREPQRGVSTAGTIAPPTSAALAVLPFIDISENRDQETFADGLSEELLNTLARIRGLEVTGRTSSFFFKGKNENLKAIGEQLGVDYLLEGSVRKSGPQLRITAQLIKAKDGFHLWSQTYDQPVQNIFQIQEDLARSVANALQIRLGVGDLARVPGMTRNVEAYEAWIGAARGSANALDPQALARMTGRLKQAVTLDPEFFFAWVDLSNSYQAAASGAPNASPVPLPEARTALEQAQRTAPSAELRDLPVLVNKTRSGDWQGFADGVAALDRFQEQYGITTLLNGPTSPGGFLVLVDKGRQAIGLLERARQRDPLNFAISLYLSEAYIDSGRIAEGIALQEQSMQQFPQGAQAIIALLAARAAGDRQGEERNWQRIRADVNDPRDFVGRMYEARNSPKDALAALRSGIAEQPRSVPNSRLAMWAVYFGDDALALQLLRDGRDLGRAVPESLSLWRPIMAGVRRMPGFKDVVRDFGFVDYWRKSGWGDHCKPVGEDDFVCR